MARNVWILSAVLVTWAASAVAADVAPPEALKWSARMPSEKIEVGKEYRVVVKLEINSQAGYRPYQNENAAFMVQLLAPDSIRLEVTERTRLLDTPYQRYFVGGAAYVDFRVISKPRPGDYLALNLVGYLAKEKDQWFVRRRGNLLLEPEAELRPTDASRTEWGDREDRLDIGDRAPAFVLPDSVERMHDLRDFLGQYYVVLAMYRHHDETFCYAPLVTLHFQHQRFDEIGAKVIGVSKEDRTLEDFKKLVDRFGPRPPEPTFITLLWDEGGKATRDYDPITYYLIDKEGIIRQIMPGTRVVRPSHRALLNELRAIIREDQAATQPADTRPADTTE